jgi:hypothetical protein
MQKPFNGYAPPRLIRLTSGPSFASKSREKNMIDQPEVSLLSRKGPINRSFCHKKSDTRLYHFYRFSQWSR